MFVSNTFGLQPRRKSGFFLFLWLVVFALLALVYWPGLSGGFYFDDMVHVVLNPFAQPSRLDWVSLARAADSSNSGPTGRPLAMLSFAFDYLLHGPSAAAMKAENVAIHAINGFLLYLLLSSLLTFARPGTPHRGLALLIAALWLFHPLQVSTALYVVQRMTLLSATFMLLGLLGYVHGRLRQHFWLAVLSLTLATAAGMFAKENALLAPVYAFLIEVCLLRFARLPETARRWIQAAYLTAPLALVVFMLVYWAFHPEWFAHAYANRTFDVGERLLTETRVLAFYQRLILLPDIGSMGLYHDDFPLSHGLFAPPTTALALLWHLALIGLAIVLRRKSPLVSFGIGWFYVSHLLESTFWPLELVFEHRNYLAIFGLLLAFYGAVESLAARLTDLGPREQAQRVMGFFVLLLAVLTVNTAVRSADWGDFFGHALMEAERHPNSSRSQFEAGQTLARGLLTHRDRADPALLAEAKRYFWASARLDPNDIAALTTLVSLEANLEKRLDDAAMTELIRRLREEKPKADTSINLHVLILQILSQETGPLFEPWADAIFDAALSNPAYGPRERAEALVGGALYLNGHDGDGEEIVRFLHEATTLVPQNLDYHILLAAKLIDLGAFEDARRVLDDVRQRDRYKIVEEEVQRLQQRLPEATETSK